MRYSYKTLAGAAFGLGLGLLLAACAVDQSVYLGKQEAGQIDDLRVRHTVAARELGLKSFYEGREAAAHGEMAQAIVYYERAALLLPYWDLPEVELGLLHGLYDNDARAALASLTRAVTINPNNPRTRLYLGQTQSQLGQDAQAEASFREALRQRPDYDEARLRLGSLYRTQKRSADAIVVYEQLLAADARNVSVWGILAGLYEDVGRFAEAEKAHRELILLQKDTAYAYYKLGLFLERRARNREAQDAFSRAASLSPENRKRRVMRPLLPSKR